MNNYIKEPFSLVTMLEIQKWDKALSLWGWVGERRW